MRLPAGPTLYEGAPPHVVECKLAEFVWRGVLCAWRVDGTVANLQAIRDVGLAPRVRPSAAEIAEIFACARCGRSVRHPRNSQTADEPAIRHYLTCPLAGWRRCAPSSRALGFAVEFCDGVDVRRWRCAVCRREYTDAEAIDFVARPASRADFRLHRRHCAHRVTRSTLGRLSGERMRAREALGQERLWEGE